MIALLILGSTIHLLREALHVLMEGVPRGDPLEEVGARSRDCQGVRSVHDLHVWNISSGRVALSAHWSCPAWSRLAAVLADARGCCSSASTSST